jgi:hypothetical protein
MKNVEALRGQQKCEVHVASPSRVRSGCNRVNRDNSCRALLG